MRFTVWGINVVMWVHTIKHMTAEIIVPFRNRSAHLMEFVPWMERFVGADSIRILVVEQADDRPFNKGALLNIGVSLLDIASTCAILHDVDLLPLDQSCEYLYTPDVTHLAGAPEQYGFSLPYVNYLGGVLAVGTDLYKRINGYSNEYWGIGCEDDDFLVRVWANDVNIRRTAGRYRSLAHSRAPVSLASMKLFFKVLHSVIKTSDGCGGVDPRMFRRVCLDQYERYPFSARCFESDGMSNLRFRLAARGRLSRRLNFGLPVSPVHEFVSVELF